MRQNLRFVATLALGVLALETLPARGFARPTEESAEIDVKRLARDQDAIRERLQKMQEKMAKLSLVLRDQGKDHSAVLLEKAVAEIQENNLRAEIERISAGLNRKEFGSAKQQEELLGRLESIYSILLDRASLEQLETDMKKLEEALRTIGELKDAQQKLTKETEATTANREELLKKAEQMLAELRQRQAALSEDTAATEASKDSRLASLSQDLSALVSRQRKERDAVEDEIERLASGKRIADAALAAQEAAQQRLENVAKASQDDGEKPSLATMIDVMKKLAETHANAAKALGESQEQNDGTEKTAPASSETASDSKAALKQAVEAAAKSAEEARTALESGEIEKAAQLAAATTAELAAARERIAERLESAPQQSAAARRQSELAEDIAELAAKAKAIGAESAPSEGSAAAADDKAASERAEAARSALERAAQQAAQASESLASPDLEAAASDQQETLDALAEAQKQIDAAAGAAGQRRAELAEKQAYAASQAEELKATLSRADRAGRQESDSAATSKATEAAKSMQQAASALRESAPAGSPSNPSNESGSESKGSESQSSESPSSESQGSESQGSESQGSQSQGSESQGSKPSNPGSEGSKPPSAESDPSESTGAKPESKGSPPAGANSPSPAQAQQRDAEQKLEELSEELAKQKAQAAEESNPPESAADSQSRYDELEKQQREIEERTRELMERIRDEKKPERDQALDDAASKMEQASNELDRRQGDEANERQQEAEKYLSKAEQDLKEEQLRYQNLRQEELLFKVREQLTSLRDDSAEMLAKTEEIHLEKVSKGKLSRLGQTNAKKIAQKSRDLRVVNADVITKLRDDGAVVFSFALESNDLDFERIADLLGTQPYRTDDFTQSIERDVVDRYETLLATLDEEIERRKQAKVEPPPEGENGQNPEQNGQQPGEQRQPLIPPLAELLLVKRMEETAMKRLDAFMVTHPELGTEELHQIARDRLTKMGLDHSRITKLFETLVDGVTEAPVEVDDDPNSGK